MDNDLISRQAAIDAILHNQEVYSNNFGNDPIDKYTIAIIDNDAQTIAQLPSAQPVRHGKWIKHMKVVHHENFDSYTPWWQCSECGQCYDATFANICNYCYYCGAKMDLERGEQDE